MIDPGLEFSTLIGGTPPNDNSTVAHGAMGLAVDDDGEVVIAGSVSDVGSPVTAGAFDTGGRHPHRRRIRRAV